MSNIAGSIQEIASTIALPKATYVAWGSSYRCIFIKLWTEQNNSHWQFTFSFPLKVNLSSLSILHMLPKTGSTVPSRFA